MSTEDEDAQFEAEEERQLREIEEQIIQERENEEPTRHPTDEEEVIQETDREESEEITDESIRKRKMKLLDEIEERLKKQKSAEMIQRFVSETDREENVKFKESLKKGYENALANYKRMLADSIRGYKDVIGVIKKFAEETEPKSMILVYQSDGNHGARLLFELYSTALITRPSQIDIKEGSK